MNRIKPIVIANHKNLDTKLENYTKLAKALVLKPLKQPLSTLPLGAAFLMGISAADAAIIYSGAQNNGCTLGGNTNRCYANINNAGGNDLEIHRNHAFGNQFIQVDEVPGGGFEINGFHAQIVGIYVYPFANSSGVNIGAAGPWGFQTGQANSLSEINGAYPNDAWTPLSSGTTRFIGIRGTVSGATRYGWMRLTKNGFGNHTIVDWAYEDTGLSILAGQTAALPVELGSFDYRLTADDLRLTWHTASEVNNAGFDVERSEDGTNFRSIAWVDGHGNASEKNDYYFDDKNLREGKTFYYRLRQVDYSGQFEFSPVITVTVGSKGAVVSEFQPNPSSASVVRLEFTAIQDADWSMFIFDTNGRELRQAQCTVNKGFNELQFDFTGFASGVYFVKLENGTERIYRKLVIE